MMDVKLMKLRKFNMIMGTFHLIQGVLMIFLATTVIQKIGEFSPQVTQYYLSYNIETQTLENASKVLFELPFGILVAVFLLLSAAAHALISLPKKTNDIYNRDLAVGINKFRWFEYALSSSVMIILISTLFGIYDIGSLILIFAANFSMNMFGLLMEELNSTKDKVNWGPFIWGSVAGIAPWIVILVYMLGNNNLDMVPWFVWAIVITYFIAFNTFPINMILQYKKVGKWKDYIYGERVYITLSLIAKTVLAWLVFFGAMQP
ncbi:MAG: heliorhodopsin HeR [Peptostreptococcaceae bacterium]|nr:heliorhodopsin HeR [Peptostreptococcaceae bacterium]